MPENLPERGTPGETREKLASEIGISGKTYSQLKTVNQKGSDELKEAKRPILEKQARERMKAGGGDQKSEDAKSGMPNLADPIKQSPVRDQLARRNLHELDKVALLEAKRPILEKQAKERQVANLKQGDKSPDTSNLTERGKGETVEMLATEAGISKNTYKSLRVVNNKGSDELKEAVIHFTT